MKFKVLRGRHHYGDKVYEVGDVMDVPTDVAAAINMPGIQRVQLVESNPDEVAAAALAGFDTIYESKPELSEAASKDAFDGKTVEELRGLAEEMEIDLGKARTRDQILAVLRSA